MYLLHVLVLDKLTLHRSNDALFCLLKRYRSLIGYNESVAIFSLYKCAVNVHVRAHVSLAEPDGYIEQSARGVIVKIYVCDVTTV